jgi:hypothetical protein
MDNRTELETLKDLIEGGDSCIEAYEKMNMVKMREEGDVITAQLIYNVLRDVAIINYSAGITQEV